MIVQTESDQNLGREQLNQEVSTVKGGDPQSSI
jgi:hypothetical protein